MKTLNLLLMSGAAAVLASSFALTGPVAAQSADSSAVDTNAVVSDHGNWTLKEREDWLDNRLHMARDDGSIDHTEFDRVRNDLDGIRDDEHHLRAGHQDGQLTDNETATLEAQLDEVASKIHWMHEDKFQRPW